jgi:methylglutamate dehydrogenase subunit D
MADTSLLPASAALLRLAHVAQAGDSNRIMVRLRDDWRLAAVLAFHDRVPMLTGFMSLHHGLALRDGPFRSVGTGVDAIGIGQRRWLLVNYQGDEAFVKDIARALTGSAAVSDHSDGYAIFEVAGSCARQMLAKGVALDLHPKSFTVADAAVTSIAHIGAIFWQLDDTPRYAIAVFRSYTDSFREFLEASSAEFA